MSYERYALYYAPETNSLLEQLGNSLLGIDPVAGTVLARPNLAGIAPDALAAMTRSASHYGFHGTLKPPFILKAGKSYDDLMKAVDQLASDLRAIETGPLKVTRLGHFIALCPSGDEKELNALAAAFVQGLDALRRPNRPEDLARHRAKGLTKQQDALLQAWGYPYVLAAFRFHLTLTDRVSPDQIHQLSTVLSAYFANATRDPFSLKSVALFGDPGNGQPFRLLRRFPLNG